MYDVVIAGAGPAGAVAAAVLARAGARVGLVDRSTFPRHKLCGDTLNPGVLAMLRRLNLASVADGCGLPIVGMILTGSDGTTAEARYPHGLLGRAITRTDFDAALVCDAGAAGVDVLEATTVLAPIVTGGRRGPMVEGLWTRTRGNRQALRAAVTIGADGRRSRLAFGLGLLRHPVRPKRWAIGAYAERVEGMSSCGEMHIRPGFYIGVAPLTNGMTNVCLVIPSRAGDQQLRDPIGALRRVLSADVVLRDRFARARFIGPPTVMGPLAVDPTGARAPDGIVFAGDAAGFVDPMTGDGLRFAVGGGELAAEAALGVLQHGWTGVARRLAANRRCEFGAKVRFNRLLRGVVGSGIAVKAATAGAAYLQPLLRSLIVRAGDCDVARREEGIPRR